MTDTLELKGCPFCGEGNSCVELYRDDVAKRWRVGCGRCGCSTGTAPRDKTRAPAIAAWNTRAQDSREPLEDALRKAYEPDEYEDAFKGSRCVELLAASKAFMSFVPMTAIETIRACERLTKAIAAFEASHEKR